MAGPGLGRPVAVSASASDSAPMPAAVAPASTPTPTSTGHTALLRTLDATTAARADVMCASVWRAGYAGSLRRLRRSISRA